jgi:heme/copper-type cytochrome/quinol oxidase subunit 1
MWGGQLTFSTPLLFALGFIALFLIGGLDGAFLAVVPFDFMVQDTYWVVSHLHYVLVAGSVFGIFAGLYYWFPKMTGRLLREGLGKAHFVLLFIGTNLAFFPQHILGLDGMPRRIVHYADNPGWAPLNLLSTVGAFMIAISTLPFLWNVFITLRGPRNAPDDPWGGNTLEWATTSPPPPYNFDSVPPIRSERPLFDLTHGAVAGHALALPAGPGETYDEMRADTADTKALGPHAEAVEAVVKDATPPAVSATPDAADTDAGPTGTAKKPTRRKKSDQ